MRLVRILKAWTRPDPMRQTPGGRGVWEEFHFTFDPVDECDYAVVFNEVETPQTVRCLHGHVWMLTQEPPNETFRVLHYGSRQYHRVFMQAAELASERRIPSQPALPWHVNRDYDFLKHCSPPEKPRRLSWITSAATSFRGHRRRMAFLERLRSAVEFDLWGRGFSPIEDKWDGLAPYRYSIAVENHSGSHYWTEKLADALLAWTMPIYCGCTNITDYFPADAIVQIDIEDPEAPQKIREVIHSDLWLQRREAIAEARRLILDRYQMFPFIADQIRAWEATAGVGGKKVTTTLRPGRSMLRRIQTKAMYRAGWLK